MSQIRCTVERPSGGERPQKETVIMTTVPTRDTVEFFAAEQLRERERVVVAELERRFGSLEAALDQEHGLLPA